MRILGLLGIVGLLSGSAHAQSSPAQHELATLPVATSLRPGQGQGAVLDSTGWRFSFLPRVSAVDDKSGIACFRIVVGEDGAIESVTPVSSTVSKAQEKLCREALLAAQFTSISSLPRRATGYYTFRFTVR